jgi:hypothetical protein
MQMSTHRSFIFIEGCKDRYFYGQVCEAVCRRQSIQYQLCLAHEISGTKGGKQVLLDFFTYLEDIGALADDFKGKRTVAIFFLDKDVDDFLDTCRMSEHIVYTQFYSVENHLIANGDLVRALAAAATLDEALVRRSLTSGNTAWRRDAAGYWKDWTKLCLFTRVRDLRHQCNYRVGCSRINNRAYAPVDAQAHTAQLGQLQRASGLTPLGFKRVFGRVSRLVDRLFEEGNHDLVFNGKWYLLFLSEAAARIAAGRPYNRNGLPDRIFSCLQHGLNFRGRWALHFKRPLEAVLRNAA